jgi:hypothetical protein
MKARCLNPNNPAYQNYGGRGITVCERWLDFKNFLEDMGERPSETQLERINNNGNYEPSNCRWASPKENSRNRRNSRYLTIDEETKPVIEWAEMAGIARSTMNSRAKNECSKEELLKPPRSGKKLEESEVRAIKEMQKSGASRREIHLAFPDIKPKTINAIIYGQNWKHID